MPAPIINKICILGLGLIGGSLAAAARKRGLVAEIQGWGRRETTLARGVELGYIDGYSLDLAGAIEGADLLLIGTPTLIAEDVLARLHQVLGDGPMPVITDVASVKGNLQRKAESLWGSMPAKLVLGHPIAGSEQSGVEAARDTLFVDHRVILTPCAQTDADALAMVRSLWSGVGADVVEMPVSDHDEILAATSHLPHALAYTLVDTLAGKQSSQDIFRFAAGGFRDFTRIASSDPTMWHDISLANRDALLAVIDDFSGNLARLREAIAVGDSQSIIELYEGAKAARDRFSSQYAAVASADE